MAEVHICNGCGRTVTSEEFHDVQATRASLPGAHRGFGLATDTKVVGEICDDCWEAIAAFVAPTSAEDRDSAREIIVPRRLAAATA